MPAPVKIATKPAETTIPTENASLPALPEPTAETVPAVDEPASEEGVNWEEVSGEPDEPEVIAGVETVEGESEVLEVTAPPTEPSATTPESAVIDPATPVVDPTATTEITEPAAAPAQVEEPAKIPPAVQPVVMSPEETLKWEQGEIDKLAQGYQLSDEEAQLINTEPETVMPKLAAIAHFRIMRSVLSTMSAMLPQMLQQHTAQNAIDSAARTDFYSENPDLDKPEFEEAVMKIGLMYRQVNPNAPRAEAIKVIGELSRTALKLNPLAASEAPAGEGAVVPNVTPISKQAKPKPFTPARGGSAPAKVATKNPWEDFLDED